MGRVATIGSLNMDIVAFCATSPGQGETVLGDSVAFLPGGKGGNQAVAAARAGATSALLGSVGKDFFGSELLKHLSAAGVDVSMVGSSDTAATGVALITVDGRGENRIVVVPGANNSVVVPEVFRAFVNTIDSVGLAQFETNLDAIIKCFVTIRQRGGLTILNPSPYRSIPPELLTSTSALILNEHEFAQFAGGVTAFDPDAIRSTLSSKDIKVQTCVVTLGEHGCVVRTSNGDVEHIPGIHVQVKDTTGAGDCFAGFFAAALSDGQSPNQAARIANAAAALSVTKLGAGTSAPTRSEVLQLLEQ